MIEVIYDGNLGNHLFQYCIARILATELGFKLKAKPINGFPRTQDVIDGLDYSEDTTPLVYRKQIVNLDYLLTKRPAKKIILNGYFQRYEYYLPYKNLIRNDWLVQELQIDDPVSKDDLVIGIRRGRDYIPHYGLPKSYYKEAIAQFKYKQLYICTNEPNDPFIRYFQKKYSAIIRPPGALDNIAFIKKFNQIIISNSTFLWWGAFLSKAEKIIAPIPLTGFWSESDPISENVDLVVPEDRFIYLKCKEKYKSRYLKEILFNIYRSTRQKLPQIVPTKIWLFLKKITRVSAMKSYNDFKY